MKSPSETEIIACCLNCQRNYMQCGQKRCFIGENNVLLSWFPDKRCGDFAVKSNPTALLVDSHAKQGR